MTGPMQLATTRFARGFNCAQSIFSAFAGEDDISEDLALRLAAPFGAGLGRAGETCGALSGALLALGLRYARSSPEHKDEIYAITREFIEQFRQIHGTILCRELVGHDISTPEGLQAARAANAFAEVCPGVVEETSKVLEKFIAEHPMK